MVQLVQYVWLIRENKRFMVTVHALGSTNTVLVRDEIVFVPVRQSGKTHRIAKKCRCGFLKFFKSDGK